MRSVWQKGLPHAFTRLLPGMAASTALVLYAAMSCTFAQYNGTAIRTVRGTEADGLPKGTGQILLIKGTERSITVPQAPAEVPPGSALGTPPPERPGAPSGRHPAGGYLLPPLANDAPATPRMPEPPRIRRWLRDAAQGVPGARASDSL